MRSPTYRGLQAKADAARLAAQQEVLQIGSEPSRRRVVVDQLDLQREKLPL